MRLQVLLSVFSCLVLTACSTVADFAKDQESKSSCCQSWGDLGYEAMDREVPTRLTLGTSSPVYAFQAGKSYFKGFALPDGVAGGKLRVRSSITGSSAFESSTLSQVYCPTVSFLDARHTVLSSESKLPVWAVGKLSSGLFPTFVSEFSVPAAARYAVMHSSPSDYGQLLTRYTGGGAYLVGSAVVVDRGGEPIVHPCGPNADAELTLITQ